MIFRLSPPWTHVWESGGQVPTLKRFLVDKVAMISTNETLGDPTLLEQRLLCAGKVGFFRKLTEGATPEVVEVPACPTLHGEADE
jgi:hypothetical protein